jgi:hypothetical protein
VVVSVLKFLTQRAVNIAVTGSYTLQKRWYDPEGRLRTFPCRTTRVSPFRMMVESPAIGQIGEQLTAYFSAFGEFEGTISDTTQGRFLFKMEMPEARRVQLAEKLAWIEKKLGDATVHDAREEARIIPPPSQSRLVLADGSTHSCSIIDMSSSSTAVAADLQLPIGTPLAVGCCIGRVVRVFDTGFAIRFVEKQNVDDLSRVMLVNQGRDVAAAAEVGQDDRLDAVG